MTSFEGDPYKLTFSFDENMTLVDQQHYGRILEALDLAVARSLKHTAVMIVTTDCQFQGLHAVHRRENIPHVVSAGWLVRCLELDHFIPFGQYEITGFLSDNFDPHIDIDGDETLGDHPDHQYDLCSCCNTHNHNEPLGDICLCSTQMPVPPNLVGAPEITPEEASLILMTAPVLSYTLDWAFWYFIHDPNSSARKASETYTSVFNKAFSVVPPLDEAVITRLMRISVYSSGQFSLAITRVRSLKKSRHLAASAAGRIRRFIDA